jgi:light-regulated signal transduction histidine kinase (bacteriophytochrome)
MRNLIHSLLEYSRIGRMNKQRIDVDLNEAVNHIIAGFKLNYPDAQFQVGLLPVICTVPVHMEQLFQNLIGNAVKFSKPGQPPYVSISAKQKGKMWQFDISDNGIGLDEKYAERIFKIFQRLQVSKEYPGSGIGLAICKKIVELYGGTISVKSKVGEGATFSFTLPVNQ